MRIRGWNQDSPVAAEFKRQSVPKIGTRYGTTWKASVPARGKVAPEILIPEVVRRGDLGIARFEVTRARFTAIDPYYKADPGTENLPAAGITFERAREYAEWLSNRKGLHDRWTVSMMS